MASAVSVYTWADHEAPLKAWLKITGTTAEDTNLQLMLASAAEDCDDFTENPFVDADGVDLDPMPSKVTMGVYEWVKGFRTYFNDMKAGRQQVKTGPLQEVYGGGVAGVEAQKLARKAAYPLWYKWVVDVTRIGKDVFG